MPLAECPETDKSKSVVTSENLISSGYIIIALSIAFLMLMTMFSSLLLRCFISQGWQEVGRHEMMRDDSWVHFDRIYSLPLLTIFAKFTLFSFSPFCRSPHFHGVTVKRKVLMDHIVKHFESTKATESKIWWECVSSWLVNTSQNSWYSSWWIDCWFSWIETLALHVCAWGRHKLLAGFWHSINLS